MFGKGITLFRLVGFEIRLDASWVVLALLITWSLAAGLFPQTVGELSSTTYWIMGACGAAGLFVSIILHELAHAVMARQYGIPIRGITLFIFGGVAEMTDEPPNAKSEFLMAIAGPVMSFLLAGAFIGAATASGLFGAPQSVVAVISFLGSINAILAIFNLIPAFPLDGGRVLRSALWAWKNQYRKATRISSQLGAGFGIILIVLGVLALISGNFIGGLWWAMIGLFLRGASKMSYRQALIREGLKGEPLRRFMKEDPVAVAPDLTLDRFVEDYVYTHHYKLFPVVDDGALRGCLSTREVRRIPRDQWPAQTVGEVATPCSRHNTISPDEDAMRALVVMNQNNASRLLVVEDGRLEGIIALKDLLRFLSVKLDLEGEEDDARSFAARAAPAE